MGAVSVDGGGGKKGKKPLDHNLPLVPFIDLLSVLISFLMMTAVWNQVARLNIQHTGAQSDTPPEQQPNTIDVRLEITERGFKLIAAGNAVEIAKSSGEGQLTYNHKDLAAKLKDIKAAFPEQRAVTLAAEDGVAYEDLIRTIDTIIGEQIPDVSVTAMSG
jgi:biopolymer transport protein ExbD